MEENESNKTKWIWIAAFFSIVTIGFFGVFAVLPETARANAVNEVLTYLEGSFGALLMAGGAIGAVGAAVLRRYKTGGALLLLAIAVFWVRSATAMRIVEPRIQAGSWRILAMNHRNPTTLVPSRRAPRREFGDRELLVRFRPYCRKCLQTMETTWGRTSTTKAVPPLTHSLPSRA
jgi:hypothetical protein